MIQSELNANTCSRGQARENAYRQVSFISTSDWLRKRREFFSHWVMKWSNAMQNQKQLQSIENYYKQYLNTPRLSVAWNS